MKFTKLHGAGNDFILVNASDMVRDWSAAARGICDRHFGVGGDGLLLLLPSGTADFRMRVFNADGSEAEVCGNGLRCLARYILDNGLIRTDATEISVETGAGLRTIRLRRTGGGTRIQVAMGKPKFGAKDIPVTVESGRANSLDIRPMLDYHVAIDGTDLYLSFVSMGNPHAVHFLNSPISEFPLADLGPKVEKHMIFPQRANFEVVRLIGCRAMEARVWERGVGETLACGSGACAAAVAAQLHGYVADRVAIVLPGGTLEVEWRTGEEVILSGPVQTVCTGDWLE